ncbi:MAG: LPS assembly lipoprotein LptE [Bdellovibrionales bacterium]
MLLLSACGFHPVYGVNKYENTGVEARFESIAIGNIPDREGQFLRNELIDRFYRNGTPTSPAYTLTLSPITQSRRDLDVTIDDDTTRAQLTLGTTMRLTDNTTKQTVLERKLESTASYNVLGSEFTNRVSEQSTRENVLKDLARRIELQTSLYFKRQ